MQDFTFLGKHIAWQSHQTHVLIFLYLKTLEEFMDFRKGLHLLNSQSHIFDEKWYVKLFWILSKLREDVKYYFADFSVKGGTLQISQDLAAVWASTDFEVLVTWLECLKGAKDEVKIQEAQKTFS